MRAVPSCAALAALAVITACATPPDRGQAGRAGGPVNLSVTEAPDPAPLEGYDIPRGRCGMILWTKAGSRIAPIFRSLDVTEATMQVEGKPVGLVLDSQSGDLALGMRSEQVFKGFDGDGQPLSVEARLDWGDGFPGGLYVRGGTLTVNGADGWSRILPVAGIAGCKA